MHLHVCNPCEFIRDKHLRVCIVLNLTIQSRRSNDSTNSSSDLAASSSTEYPPLIVPTTRPPPRRRYPCCLHATGRWTRLQKRPQRPGGPRPCANTRTQRSRPAKDGQTSSTASTAAAARAGSKTDRCRYSVQASTRASATTQFKERNRKKTPCYLLAWL